MKMIRFIAISTFLCTTANVCVGQLEQLHRYKVIYKVADSLNELGRPFSIDSTTKIEVKQLDKEHPVKYFQKATELFNANKFNEASFLFYLGTLRYKYYNSVNPSYESGGDGALAASLQYTIGETINLYLKTNVDNFISALKYSADYYRNNDYAFYSRQKNTGKYDNLFDNFEKLIRDLEQNKDKYKKQWDEDRSQMIINIDKAIEEYNKMSPMEKEKLRKTD